PTRTWPWGSFAGERFGRLVAAGRPERPRVFVLAPSPSPDRAATLPPRAESLSPLGGEGCATRLWFVSSRVSARLGISAPPGISSYTPQRQSSAPARPAPCLRLCQ